LLCTLDSIKCNFAFKSKEVFVFFGFFLIHLLTCAYIVWVISPPYPLLPPFPTLPPSLPGRTSSALISNFVEEKTLA
jgi:hypothetical protein